MWTKPSPISYRHPPDKLANTVHYLPMTEKTSAPYSFVGNKKERLSSTVIAPRLWPDIENWCASSIRRKYGICHIPRRLRADPQYDYAIWFEWETDAILFKLKWL